MKYFKFLTMATLVAASVAVTSCNESDDPASKAPDISNLVAESYTIMAFSNAPAVFTLDAAATIEQSADKKGVKYTNIQKDQVKITATLIDADGFVTTTQTATVNLSKESTNATISFDFAKKSTDTKTQAQVAASKTDLTISSNLSEVDASLTLPAGLTVTGTSTDDFSITAYETPASIITDEEAKVGEQIEDVKLIAFEGTPSGSAFSEEVGLSIFVGEELKGKTLKLENNGKVVVGEVKADGYVTFEVPHFSIWYLMFEPYITKKEKGTISLLETTMDVVYGENKYTYTKNTGAYSNDCDLFNYFVEKELGEQVVMVDETGSFTSDKAGKINLSVVQSYTDYTFDYQGYIAHARKWGNVTATATPVGGGEGHSGGLGK